MIKLHQLDAALPGGYLAALGLQVILDTKLSFENDLPILHTDLTPQAAATQVYSWLQENFSFDPAAAGLGYAETKPKPSERETVALASWDDPVVSWSRYADGSQTIGGGVHPTHALINGTGKSKIKDGFKAAWETKVWNVAEAEPVAPAMAKAVAGLMNGDPTPWAHPGTPMFHLVNTSFIGKRRTSGGDDVRMPLVELLAMAGVSILSARGNDLDGLRAVHWDQPLTLMQARMILASTYLPAGMKVRQHPVVVIGGNARYLSNEGA